MYKVLRKGIKLVALIFLEFSKNEKMKRNNSLPFLENILFYIIQIMRTIRWIGVAVVYRSAVYRMLGKDETKFW